MAISTIDDNDKETWKSLEQDWDGPSARMDCLLSYTPLRMHFLRHHLIKGNVKPSGAIIPGKPLSGYQVLDIGCGGGYVAEALVAQGASVVAVDCNEAVIERNQQRQLLDKDANTIRQCLYLKSTAEDLVRSKKLADESTSRSFLGRIWNAFTTLGQSEIAATVIPQNGYDIVVASEVLEHVSNPRYFIKCLDDLLKPDGLMVITTPNRSWFSKFSFITLAENLLKIVPKGVHDPNKFVRHEEVAYFLNATRCGAKCQRSSWQWPRLWLRQWLMPGSPISPLSPLYSGVKDSWAVRHRYRHLGTQGIFFVPKLNLWTRAPVKSLAYMAAFQKGKPFEEGLSAAGDCDC